MNENRQKNEKEKKKKIDYYFLGLSKRWELFNSPLWLNEVSIHSGKRARDELVTRRRSSYPSSALYIVEK